MSRIRMFVAAVVAAFSVLTMVHSPSAGAIIVRADILEDTDPNAPPPEPNEGDILSLCVTIRRAGPNPITCVQI